MTCCVGLLVSPWLWRFIRSRLARFHAPGQVFLRAASGVRPRGPAWARAGPVLPAAPGLVITAPGLGRAGPGIAAPEPARAGPVLHRPIAEPALGRAGLAPRQQIAAAQRTPPGSGNHHETV